MAVFTAYIFQGANTAQNVLEKLENLDEDYLWIDDVAVVSKKKNGRLHIHSTWAQDDMGASGFGWGAFTGALLGLIASPASALAGAALGGSLWGLFGLTMDEILDDPKLDEFGKKLQNNTSALVLVTDEKNANSYEVAMEPYEGEIVKVNIDDKDVALIKEKIQQTNK